MNKTVLDFVSKSKENSDPQPYSGAKVVDGRLVLSLTDAIKPVVWQFDISVAKSSAVELRETNGGETTLVLKTAKQDVQDIASYDTPSKAVKALLAISRAMERAQGHMNAPQAGTYPPPAIIPHTGFNLKSIIAKLFMNLLTVMVILFLLFLAVVWFVPLSGSGDQASVPQVTEQAPLSAPAGEAQSADEFLGQ
jgi:hypothetical protein